MKLTEETLEHKVVFEGNIITMRQDTVRLENGKTATRDVIEHRGGVCVLPLTDQNEVIMVKQFRYPYHEVLLEIPAGKLDRIGEDPLQCGKRELEEETGMVADEYLFLGKMYPSPGYCEEIVHIYLARGLHPSKQHLDEDEFLEVYRIPFEQIVQEVIAGKITDAKTQIAVLKAARLIGQ